MMELEQETNFNLELKKQLMLLAAQLRDLDDANLEEGVILKIEYPDVPNLYFQIVVQELDEDSVLETEIDKRVH
jgi:hypothetical protein|tara:strand:+ start:150 stop:371 length:222 start_codon:yes stop_codon:yes gene_type:complete